jgi:hypothetical protein
VTSVVLVHGIWNFQPGLTPGQAASSLAESLRPRLEKGLQKAGLGHVPMPELTMAYYAHLLTESAPEMQSSPTDSLENLSYEQLQVVWEWLVAAGAPDPAETQAWLLAPVRQGLSWIVSNRYSMAEDPTLRHKAVELLSRVAAATISNVDAYTSRPARRQRVRNLVADTIRDQQASVVVAHSLGSIVAYEALHEHPDLEVDLFVTLGSPMGIPALFRKLDPEPLDGMGSRPLAVRRWVNIADSGDLVAIPPNLGNLFPVNQHAAADLGPFNPHTLGGYLSEGMAAAAIASYL